MTKPSLRKIADIENRIIGEHKEKYVFRKENGSMGEIVVSPADARKLHTFTTKLQNCGALLPPDPKTFIQQATTREPRKRLVQERRTGWLADQSGFVLADGFIGRSAENICGIATPEKFGTQGQVSRAGTVEAWKNSVGLVAAYSSTAITGICAAFAAPLLHFKRARSFGICFSGNSASGKTTAICAAASVIGLRSPEYLFSWNLTKAQLEQRLSQFNDCLFPIDDLQVIEGDDEQRYQRMHHLAYAIAQGHTKGRHSSYVVDRIGDGSWRSVLITSSEVSIHSLATATGKSRAQGTTHRLIDVPVSTCAAGQIFDMKSEAKNEGWRKQQFRRLYRGCEDNHGAPFERYIERLISFSNQRDAFIDSRIEYFMGKVDCGTSLLQSLAKSFAFLYAGGMLAKKFGIVNWKQKTILKALIKNFNAAADLMPPSPAAIRLKGKKKLKVTLQNLPRQSQWLDSPSSAIGLRLPGKEAAYRVTREGLNMMFDTLQQKNLVIEWLKKTKRLQMSSPKNGGSSRVKDQFVWPDGSRRRSYTIYWVRKA
jgi:hypothetical protein